MRCRRDAVLLLIGFWRGFRGDELARLQVEDTQAEAGIGITFYQPYTKGDRNHRGRTYHTPALKKLCPVEAYINWITVAGITKARLFESSIGGQPFREGITIDQFHSTAKTHPRRC